MWWWDVAGAMWWNVAGAMWWVVESDFSVKLELQAEQYMTLGGQQKGRGHKLKTKKKG